MQAWLYVKIQKEAGRQTGGHAACSTLLKNTGLSSKSSFWVNGQVIIEAENGKKFRFASS
jgi:hypothetical protein